MNAVPRIPRIRTRLTPVGWLWLGIVTGWALVIWGVRTLLS